MGDSFTEGVGDPGPGGSFVGWADRLAVLLAERAGTTARVQRVKEVPGHAGRDAERERQIATRMARLAPVLGPERLQRIMHAVITESLDAAEAGPENGRP